VLFAAGLSVLAGPAAAQDSQPPAPAPEWPSQLVMLVRDPAVQAELGLSAEQSQQVAAAVDAVDRELWVLRDQSAEQGGPALARLVSQLAGQLKPILEARQRQRLDQLLIQARGVAGLVQPSVAKRLGLSAEQLAQMRAIQAETAAAVAEVRKQAEGNPSAALSEQAAKLQADGQKRLGEVLTLEQRERLAALVGQPFEFAKLKRIAARAPEFAGVQTWLNGPPRTLLDLRGKVIALHFFAFG
jgi:hypothetical protein